MNAQDAWNAAYHQLEMQLDRATFDTWLRDVVLLSVEGDTFVIGVRNQYALEMLQQRLYRTVRRVVGDSYGRSVEVRFQINKPTPQPAAEPADMPLFQWMAQQPAAPSLPLHHHVARPERPDVPESELNPRYVFERFMAGSENQMVYAAAQAVAEHPASVYNPLFLYGGVGLGKTHLLHSIAHACKQRGLRVIYITSEAFTNDLVDSIRARNTAMFREKYRSVDVLLVDDIQFISGKDSTQEEFFHTFNALYTFNKQIVLASDKHPRELAQLEARLRSRFEGGLVMDVLPPAFETRVAILRTWAAEKGVQLSRQVCELLADRAKTNVRELEGIFNRVVMNMHHSGHAVNPQLAEEIVQGYHRPRYQLTITQVLEATAQHFRLRTSDLIGPRRTGPINNARQIAMFLARELTTSSLPQIGDAFGGRKHSTVLHSCNKVLEDIEHDDELAQAVETIRGRLVKE